MRRRTLWREKPENPTGWCFSSGTFRSPGESSQSPFHAMDSAKTCVTKFKSFAILLFTPILMLPLVILIPDKFARCAYVIVIMAVYWCTDVIPVAVTSLLPVLLFPLLKVLDSKQVCIQYMKDTNMLFLGSLIVAVAVERWKLHKRVALRMLLFVGTKPSRLMLGFMFVTAFLSMWISNTAATAMMIPIVEAMLQQMIAANTAVEASLGTLELLDKNKTSELPGSQVVFEDPNVQEQEDEETKNMYKAMHLCVCYSASIGGTATLTGTGPNVVLLGQMQELFPDSKDVLNYASWFGFAFPNMVMMLVLAWLWLQCLYMRHNHITDATVAIFVAILLFIIPSQKPKFNFSSQTEEERKTPFYPPALLDWKVAQEKVPWDIVLLLGGGFAMAKGCETSGLSKWMAAQMEPLRLVKPAVITLILSCLVAMTTECTSNVATTTLFLPIFASMARSIGIHPLYVMIPCTMSASLAFMLPVATPPNAIVFAYGHLRVVDMMKTGLIMNFVGILSVFLSVNTWGRAMFNLDNFPDWANSTSVNT
ncbi:Na(+)/citrate cotransporter isoform X3 [Mus musculus]|uniref:Na(+)/citrate cotransporter isoform X3 n=2 Tax=Mus musculus TaxID=10090 RepID=UPI0016789189|nr:Na(+)/citrate cotransporter isoform X3 [Mus musculus]